MFDDYPLSVREHSLEAEGAVFYISKENPIFVSFRKVNVSNAIRIWEGN